MSTMLRRRMMTIFVSVGAAALLAPAALAATPGEIAADMADGRADGTYTKAELQAYFQSAMVQGYGEPTRPPAVTPPQTGVAGGQAPTGSQGAGETERPVTEGVAGAQTPLDDTATTGTLPFTGLDLALLVVGGMMLLALGYGARRLGQR